MNYKLTLAQPAYYYTDNGEEIQPNLRKNLYPVEEIVYLGDEVELVKNVEDFEPFTKLIKVVEKEVEGYSVYGYYLVGVFTLDSLKTAISNNLVMKRTKHPAFSSIPIPESLEDIVISYDDTRLLVEYGRNVKFLPRKGK